MMKITEKKKKIISFSGTALSLIVLTISLIFYRREYLPWENLGLLYALAAISCLAFCSLTVFVLLLKEKSVLKSTLFLIYQTDPSGRPGRRRSYPDRSLP